MSGRKKKLILDDHKKKQKTVNLVWRPVATKASCSEESWIKDVVVESEDGGEVQQVDSSTASAISNDQAMNVPAEAVVRVTESAISVSALQVDAENKMLKGDSAVSSGKHSVSSLSVAAEAVVGVTESAISVSALQVDAENKMLKGDSAVSSGKHSVSVEVGASLFGFIKGKGESTQKKIEEEVGVKIIIPSSKEDDYVAIEGDSIDSVTSASERIQAIINEAVKSRNLDYSHFISLPLAIHPELVDKLVSFQNSILGNGDSCVDENHDSDSNDKADILSDKEPNVALELKVNDSNESVKVNLTNIPLVSYTPKASKSSTLSDLGIDKSIFTKPKTFHLTVLMLKLWNKSRVNAAADVLQSISTKVMEALDNRPVSIRLKGLDCMKGSLAKARVLYAPVEEIGSEGRLLRACQVIIDAFVEAGLVLEDDAKHKLKLHATVMNASHRKRQTRRKKSDSFDARDIFKQYGSEDWGEYLIREAHLSQRFLFDENGYYHCCTSIPFPENMQVE